MISHLFIVSSAVQIYEFSYIHFHKLLHHFTVLSWQDFITSRPINYDLTKHVNVFYDAGNPVTFSGWFVLSVMLLDRSDESKNVLLIIVFI